MRYSSGRNNQGKNNKDTIVMVEIIKYRFRLIDMIRPYY